MEKNTASGGGGAKQPPPERKSVMIPPDEQRCCRNDGVRWRCTKFRMNLGVSKDDGDEGLDTKYCENHYNFFKERNSKKQRQLNNQKNKRNNQKKSSSGDDDDDDGSSSSEDDDSSSSGTETWDSNSLEWKKVANHSKEIQQGTTNDTISDIEGGSANVGTKRKEMERTDSLTENPCLITSNEMIKKKDMENMKLPPDEQRYSYTNGNGTKRYRCKNFRTSLGADDTVPKSKHCEKHYNYYKNLKKRSAPGPIRKKRKTKERRESSTKSREPLVEFENMEHYKSKCFELSVELEKKNVECISLQGELRDLRTRKNAAKDETEPAPEDAAEYWRKMLSNIESRLQRIENENSTMRCVESRFTKLESLVLSNGKVNSKLRCADLHNSETKESEAQGFQNDVCERKIDKNNMSKPNAETSKRGNKDSQVFELKPEEKVLKNAYDIGQNKKHHELESAVNISSGNWNLSSAGHYAKQGKGWGRGEETPFQPHSDISKKTFVKLVSENNGESVEDDSDSCDSNCSLSDLWERVAMKCRNRNNDREIKWKFEADMLSSFEEDPELCTRAVCALYRHQISADTKGLFHYSDALRGTTLAKFLMDGACTGDLKKSLKDLETLDSKAVEDCKRLARRYSKQLFSIYQNKKDPYFLPTTTAIHGHKTSK